MEMLTIKEYTEAVKGLPEKENRYALAMRTKKKAVARAYLLKCRITKRNTKRVVTTKANHGIMIVRYIRCRNGGKMKQTVNTVTIRKVAVR